MVIWRTNDLFREFVVVASAAFFGVVDYFANGVLRSELVGKNVL